MTTWRTKSVFTTRHHLNTLYRSLSTEQSASSLTLASDKPVLLKSHSIARIILAPQNPRGYNPLINPICSTLLSKFFQTMHYSRTNTLVFKSTENNPDALSVHSYTAASIAKSSTGNGLRRCLFVICLTKAGCHCRAKIAAVLGTAASQRLAAPSKPSLLTAVLYFLHETHTRDAASALDQYSTASWGTAQILHINFLLFSELKEAEQGQGTAIESSSLTHKTVCFECPFWGTHRYQEQRYLWYQMLEQNFMSCFH